MFWVRNLVFVAVCIVMPSAIEAKNIKIDGDEPRKTITVSVEDASVGDILKDFSRIFDFEVKGLENAQRSEPVSLTMAGSLGYIIERLLRNWNHMIIRSPDNKSGIQKVIILDSAYGSAPGNTQRNNIRNLTPGALQRRLSQQAN